MQFETPLLRLESKGDPLWLYKVCVSLVEEAALAWGYGTGKDSEAAAGFIAGQIHRSDPAVTHVLAPVIDVLTQEAASLNRVFRLFPGRDDMALREEVRRDVLDCFRKSAALRSLHNAGTITAEEFDRGALALVKALDKYGANGQQAMLQSWKDTGRNLVAELRASQQRFMPEKLDATPNISRKEFTRAGYYNKHHTYLTGLTKHDPVLAEHQACMATIGPEYQAAINAKESLLSRHLTKKIIFGSDGAVLMAALHPQYERAKKAAVRGIEPAYAFNSPTLAGEIGGEEGARFMRAIDAEAARSFDHSAIVKEIRGAAGAAEPKGSIAAAARQEAKAAGAPNAAAAKPALIEHQPSPKVGPAAVAGQVAEATHGAHTGARLALAGAAGIVLYDGLTHLHEEPKPGDDARGRNLRFGRVVEVGMGVAGLAAAMLCKGATFDKLLGGRSR